MSTEAKVSIVLEEGREATFRYLASLDDLRKSGQLTRWVDDHDILLYEYEGQIKALSNICRHFGGPVGYHKHKDGVFTCLWHNWQYSCKDGSCLSHPALPQPGALAKLHSVISLFPNYGGYPNNNRPIADQNGRSVLKSGTSMEDNR